MGPVVVTCDGCGVRIRVARPETARTKSCPRCESSLREAVDRAVAEIPRLEPSAPAPLVAPVVVVEETRIVEPAPPAPRRAPSRRAVLVQVALSGVLLTAAVTYGLASRPAQDAWTPSQVVSRAIDEVEPEPAPLPAPEPPPQPEPGPEPPVETTPPPPTLANVVDDPAESVAVAMAPTMPAPPVTPAPTLATPLPAAPEVPGEPRRILVRDESGRAIVTRVYHAEADQRPVVVLPDGQIHWVEGRAYTDQPFRPATPDEIRSSLLEGPYDGYKSIQSDHYLVVYRCSDAFAGKSARLLESLYQGLSRQFAEWGLDVHPSEFPMVAIIYDTEATFRRENQVPPDVQAFYHTLSNRIFFYETGDNEQISPEVAAIRKPQTVAHEGTHQILSNIGVQPRLAHWPIWLIEGLAEYCSPTFTKKGAEWAGIGRVNPLHMATIHDLKEQADLQRVQGMQTTNLGYDPRKPLVEYLVTRTELTPTDYALAWALTHYLASEKAEAFRAFLKKMSKMTPGAEPSPADQLQSFREAFGSDLARADRAVAKHLGKLRYDPLPYYAVVFEQPRGDGMIQKAALVSQSPSMIRQWLESIQSPQGQPYTWRAVPFPTRTRAMATVDQWIRSQ